MSTQKQRTESQRLRLQHKLRRKWLDWVEVLDNKLGFRHCPRTAMLHGTDYGTVCLLRSLMRYLHGANQKSSTTVVLMVLHDVHGPTDRYLQAVFTAEEMRHYLATQPVLHDVHMQREIEAHLNTVPVEHVVVVHLAASKPPKTPSRMPNTADSKAMQRWEPMRRFCSTSLSRANQN